MRTRFTREKIYTDLNGILNQSIPDEMKLELVSSYLWGMDQEVEIAQEMGKALTTSMPDAVPNLEGLTPEEIYRRGRKDAETAIWHSAFTVGALLSELQEGIRKLLENNTSHIATDPNWRAHWDKILSPQLVAEKAAELGLPQAS